ncbi:unnamed protein product [Meloidogyne enterolobii]|uniref:Uncharacterized protein n=1 Tax=Meloidogyne enterolobii TaxID=390850 RepID=A0ACB0Z3I0_MELEN
MLCAFCIPLLARSCAIRLSLSLLRFLHSASCSPLRYSHSAFLSPALFALSIYFNATCSKIK